MNQLIQLIKAYWYLFLISLVLILPCSFVMMVGVWIIGAITTSMWVGYILSAFLASCIAALPLLFLVTPAKDKFGSVFPIRTWFGSIFIYFLLFLIIGSLVVVR